MNKKSAPLETASEFRIRAETQLSQSRPDSPPVRTEAESRSLMHELEVHQVELEIQNAELMESRDRVEVLLKTYTDLYDFAPVGYFSVGLEGNILETNLTGAKLLGVERSLLIGHPLQRYLAPSSRLVFQAFFKKVFKSSEKQICEVLFRNKLGASFWADLQAESSTTMRGTQKWCRVAMSDVSALKLAEEARNRVEILAAANVGLSQEIARREKVEQELKSSESHYASLLEESRLMELQLRQLSRQLLQAQEEERKQISRDLHDEIIQVLVGINVNLAALSMIAQLDVTDLAKQILRTQRLVEKAVDIVHRFARELRPDMLDDLGLIPSLQSLCQEFTKRTKIPVKFDAKSKADKINSNKRTIIFRIAQAALSNIRKHAAATEVHLTVQEIQDLVRIEIHDNGKSFNVDKVLLAKKYKRLGLIGSRERVEMVGGTFEIVSSPGNGTSVKAGIPNDPLPKLAKS